MRDSQKGKVYKWEKLAIAKHDLQPPISFSDAQTMVDYIWADQGLECPPKVVQIDPRVSTHVASADRFEISISSAGIRNWILIHEIAHSMTSTFEGTSAWHGPLFVGMYIKLVNKYMRIPLEDLYASADAANVKYIKEARPTIDLF